MTTTFVSKEVVREEFLNSVERLKNKLDRVRVALTEDLCPLQKNSYHFVTRLLKPEQRFDKILYSHIFETALRSERLSAGSGFLSVLNSVGFIQELAKVQDNTNDHERVEAYQREGGGILELIGQVTTRITPDQLRKNIEGVCQDQILSQVVVEAVNLAGMEGNIRVEGSRQTGFSVELRHGYGFKCSVPPSFLSVLKTWEAYDVKVLVIDGLVEKVSELDKVLQKASDTKIPLVIVAQGFSDEVMGTIAVNTKSGRFNIVPVCIEQSLENLNILNDVSVVSGADVVSVLKGDMLVYVDFDTLACVDHVVCTETELVVTHSTTHGSVGNQIKSLIEKRNQQRTFDQLDIGTLLDKRISNLLSHAVIIRLPNVSSGEQESLRTRIDIALRTARTSLTHGTVSKDRFLQLLRTWSPASPVGKVAKLSLELSLSSWENETIPALSLYSGFWFSGKTMLSLMASSGLVLVDV